MADKAHDADDADEFAESEEQTGDDQGEATEPKGQLKVRPASASGLPPVVAYRTQQVDREPQRAGFFTVRKSGQGYWTRMGTVAAAAVIIGSVAWFLYTYMPSWGARSKLVIGGVTAGVCAVLAGVAFAAMNRPNVVDFLIATDSEMKKVNWTTRKELIGSTKVVVLCVILIGLVLFAFDMVFWYIFWLIGVLKFAPLS